MAELDTRKPREQTLRVSDPIHEEYPEYYEESSLLSTKNIPARPGYVQRWVRTAIHGNEDQSNVFKKINKGWRPRERSTVPKGQYVMHVDFEGVDVIGIKGMILMERPEALHERQRKSVQEATKLQMMAVKNDLYGMNERGGRITEVMDKTEVSRGRPAVVDD